MFTRESPIICGSVSSGAIISEWRQNSLTKTLPNLTIPAGCRQRLHSIKPLATLVADRRASRQQCRGSSPPKIGCSPIDGARGDRRRSDLSGTSYERRRAVSLDHDVGRDHNAVGPRNFVPMANLESLHVGHISWRRFGICRNQLAHYRHGVTGP